MAYTKASDVLPEHLLEAIQNYIDGDYIYIPRKTCNRKAWGAAQNSRQRLDARNSALYQKYRSGIPVQDLAALYYLSVKTIYKIIAAQNKN